MIRDNTDRKGIELIHRGLQGYKPNLTTYKLLVCPEIYTSKSYIRL